MKCNIQRCQLNVFFTLFFYFSFPCHHSDNNSFKLAWCSIIPVKFCLPTLQHCCYGVKQGKPLSQTQTLPWELPASYIITNVTYNICSPLYILHFACENLIFITTLMIIVITPYIDPSYILLGVLN
jgi:hypothetical protein